MILLYVCSSKTIYILYAILFDNSVRMSILINMSNTQKRTERRQESWNKSEAKRASVKERETWTGRARMANTVAGELFDNREPSEADDLE